jgi:hypothetical protein
MSLKAGDTIEVKSLCQTFGMKGVIEKIIYPYSNKCKYVSAYIAEIDAMRVYNARNVKLIEGCIKIIERDSENKMMSIIKDYKQIIGVKFLKETNNYKEYYFASFEDEIKINDLVLCDTVTGFAIGKVTNIYEKGSIETSVTKEIITVINTKDFEARKETRIKKEELKRKMDNRVKELQCTAIYEILAEKDNDLAKMLEEYKSL